MRISIMKKVISPAFGQMIIERVDQLEVSRPEIG
jgi:hypothetical protein